MDGPERRRPQSSSSRSPIRASPTTLAARPSSTPDSASPNSGSSTPCTLQTRIHRDPTPTGYRTIVDLPPTRAARPAPRAVARRDAVRTRTATDVQREHSSGGILPGIKKSVACRPTRAIAETMRTSLSSLLAAEAGPPRRRRDRHQSLRHGAHLGRFAGAVERDPSRAHPRAPPELRRCRRRHHPHQFLRRQPPAADAAQSRGAHPRTEPARRGERPRRRRRAPAGRWSSPARSARPAISSRRSARSPRTRRSRSSSSRSRASRQAAPT